MKADDDIARERIEDLCARGDEQARRGDYPNALKHYWMAWDLLPQPKTDSDTATWILGSIGDANFLCGDFKAGCDNLSQAMHCPNGIGNAFLHLRLGQCRYEVGNMERAADELTRAFMGEGEEIFSGENPKYLAFLKTRIRPSSTC